MKVVAFLQNMWVKPHQVRTVSRYAPTSREREKMIEYALFAGCLTGRRLHKAFGKQRCGEIIWQEANPTIADNPKEYYPADAAHIAAVLEQHQPEVVLCFTRMGEKVIQEACGFDIRFIPVVHPACRHPSTMEKLHAAAEMLITCGNRP